MVGGELEGLVVRGSSSLEPGVLGFQVLFPASVWVSRALGG